MNKGPGPLHPGPFCSWGTLLLTSRFLTLALAVLPLLLPDLLALLALLRLRGIPWADHDLQGLRHHRKDGGLGPYDLSVDGELQAPRARLHPDLLRSGEENPFASGYPLRLQVLLLRSSAKVISLPSGSLTVAAFTNPDVPWIGPTGIPSAFSAASCSSRLLTTRVTLDDPARSA